MIIIKAGGGRTINWDYICQDIASLTEKEEVILIHGASVKRDEVAEKLGLPTKTVVSPSGISSVYTDKEAIKILTMVYAGLANKQIVAKLQGLGINAIGLSGADGRIWEGKRKRYLLAKENGKTKLIKDTFTGKVENVNARLIKLLIKAGYLPVITQPTISYEGELINTDNDRAIAVMAQALGVEKLVVLFESPGLLRDYQNESSLIRKVNKEDLIKLMKYANGRMRKKILGTIEAFDMGVKSVYWGDGRVKNPIKKALACKGTVIK